MKKCLFLGYKKKDTCIIYFIKKKGWQVEEWGNKKPNIKFCNYDLIISFGYKNIIKKKFLNKCKRPIINLHASYLPYNRGAHPNFWSFINNTPKGISIHEIDEKVDRGKLIYRKRINFKKNVDSFETTYDILKKKLERLFISKLDFILNKSYKPIKINKVKSYHLKKELPKFMKNWKIKISEAKKLFKYPSKK
tara:strand:- start:10356 stop:10934 length:579 start_codon:yes stop_codon:yes gene_type:complete